MPTPFEEAAGGTTPSSAPSLPPVGESSTPPGEQSVSLPTGGSEDSPPSSSAAPAPAPAPAPWDNLPRSWKKDYMNDWGSLPQNIREYIHTREEQVSRGILGYKQNSGRWQKAIEPFESVLQQHPDVDPVELIQVLARNHLALVQGGPEQRRELLAQVAKHYGVDFAQAAAQATAPSGQQPVVPAPQSGFTAEQMRMLQQMLQPVVGKVQSALQFAEETRLAEAQTAVDKFFSDPKNEFAEDVAQDMLQILQSRKAESLNEAYEMAIMRNPEVKARYLASLAAKASPPASAPAPLNLKSSRTPVTPPAPASMEDTINAVIAKHYGT